ncbi:hypothetical protein TR75_01735 [Hydrogenibacillus schlegelii]|uniref:Uncharacterized protein n=1 Tax=Hydrogenibacillus schlegelii TaxID=1484 RepID=A0A132NCM9_HYDSH|nr:hypothetical protein TR75_01735 [Hydrogenibacillus schlegelii]OAR04606.1 hypothetical protein SA87_08685 [Hydrogenibacillus schlegelii]
MPSVTVTFVRLPADGSVASRRGEAPLRPAIGRLGGSSLGKAVSGLRSAEKVRPAHPNAGRIGRTPFSRFL